MAKKKNHWYVVVMANDGAVFVTENDWAERYAHWNKDEKPLEMGESLAKDLAFGLQCNWHNAYAVCSPVEIEHQPYRYDAGHFEWVFDEKQEE